MTDDHGDQFPGAIPAPVVPTAPRSGGTDERLVRMRAAYTEKVNAAVQADRENLAYELAEQTFAEDLSDIDAPDSHLALERRPVGRRTPPRGRGGRPVTMMGRMGGLTRRSLDQVDRYTLDAFNPRPPHTLYTSRPDRSA